MVRTAIALGATALLLATALAAGSAAASAPRYGAFKTPSGNIVCGYGYGGTISPAFIECGILSGLKPAPTNTCTDIDYSGKRVSLTATGRAVPVVCAGDPGPFLSLHTAGVLAYGRSWKGAGITCTSGRTGLTCRNLRGHGFFLSRERWRSF
jgi:hypothetical protein